MKIQWFQVLSKNFKLHTLAATIFRTLFLHEKCCKKGEQFFSDIKLPPMIKKRFSHHIKLRERICDLNRPVYFYQIYKPDSELTGTI